MTTQTKAEFVADGLYKMDNRFNAARPENRRVKKPKDRKRVTRGLERGFDLREQGANVDTIRAEVKKAMFGSGILAMLLSFIISNWGDDIIAFIISLLFPATMGAAPAEVWIVGRYIQDVPGGIAWEFQGAFACKDAAVSACRDGSYFVGPATLGESRDHDTEEWEGCYYPLAT